MADSKLEVILSAKNDTQRAFSQMNGTLKTFENHTKTAFLKSTGYAGAFIKQIFSLQTAFAGAAGIYGAKKLIDAASNLSETVSKSGNVFKDQAQNMMEWAKGSAEGFGLSTQAALENAASIGNMFDQLGAGTQVAAKNSKQMVELAADLASFHNAAGGANEVLLAMQSAFRGEYDALQRYIPTIKAASVEQEAMALTGKASAKQLTELEKALAAQNIMLRDAGAAMGDFARTSGQAANQQRILAANTSNIAAQIGQGLLPVYEEWINKVNQQIQQNPQIIDQTAEFAKNMADLADTLLRGALAGAGYFNVMVKTYQALGLASAGVISYKTALTDGAEAVERFNRGLSQQAKIFKIGPQTPGYDIYKPPSSVSSTYTPPALPGIPTNVVSSAAAETQGAFADTSKSGYVDFWQLQYQERYEVQSRALDEIVELEEQTSGQLIEISQRTSEAMENNFSSFFKDMFRGELDGARDYFQAFCYSLTDSFSDMLGQMMKQMIFGGGSSGGGGFFSFLTKGITGLFGGGGLDASAGLGLDWIGTLFHKGGVVGSDAGMPRTVPAALFMGAPRLHGGLAPDEFPAILQRGETVIPRDQGGSVVNNNISIAAMDARSFAEFAQRNGGALVSAVNSTLEKNTGGRHRMKRMLR